MAAHNPSQWTPADYTPALQHLARLQHQLTALRTILPATIDPLSTAGSSPSPDLLYTRFASSATAAVSSIATFRAAWEDEETLRIMERVRESVRGLDKAPIAVARWWDDGLDDDFTGTGLKEVKLEGSDVVVINDFESGATKTLKEEMEEEIQRFRVERPDCVAETVGDDGHIQVTVPAGSRRLAFMVKQLNTSTLPAEARLQITCIGTSKLHEAITRCLEKRANQVDVYSDLEMLGAYADLGAAKCNKCYRLLDSSAMLPTARRRRDVKGASGAGRSVWDAFHEGCL